MVPKCLGLYTFIQDLGKGLYKLKSLENPDIQIKRINGAHLKLYKPKLLPLPPGKHIHNVQY